MRHCGNKMCTSACSENFYSGVSGIYIDFPSFEERLKVLKENKIVVSRCVFKSCLYLQIPPANGVKEREGQV